ncbi:hypothetical protein MAPG_10852 [Magnaporthiopsis poae ATCC 64411]|uniref:Mitochondrial carrier protein pet8 n=1 Tax=Magnaporthiopsis poae (strain ATCC 64411 / 73-15) TaxID=644358 RepID=A0A0C4EDP6_MAGP6|nr:hypothetical protein MAPG_10852 [Magnaporthiopsis poae ATCC 64411]
MSSRILLRTVAAAGRPAATIPRRGLATSPQLAHKETSHNDESHDVHRHKDDLMNKHKQGKAHWKAELASNSEEAVKADREAAREAKAGPDQTKDHLQRLQERTKHHAEKTSKAGTSDGDGM